MINNVEYNQMESIKIGASVDEHPETFQNKLTKLFHSYRFHLFVIALVVVDCLIVITELILELNILNKKCDKQHSESENVIHVLHFVSLGILSLFMIEIILKIYAFRILFVKSCMEMFDAFVIITSFVLDIVFIGKNNTTAIIGDLIIGLRLWRIIRVIHGIILSVKTPIEHSLEKEKENCANIQLKLDEATIRASALEKDVQQLRNVLKDHNIDIGYLQTHFYDKCSA